MVDYNNGIPAPTHNPSNDVALMQSNTDAIDTILQTDHISFNQDNGGMHLHVTFPTAQTDPGLSANQTQIYPKSFGSTTTYLETYGSITDSTATAHLCYLPMIKAMAQFEVPLVNGPATIVTTNTLNINVATVTQTANGFFDVVFTTNLPYATYYVFGTQLSTGPANNAFGVLTRLVSGFTIRCSAPSTSVIGFVVI